MVIYDFNACRTVLGPLETDPVLAIDAYRVLPLTVAVELFQLIARWL